MVFGEPQEQSPEPPTATHGRKADAPACRQVIADRLPHRFARAKHLTPSTALLAHQGAPWWVAAANPGEVYAAFPRDRNVAAKLGDVTDSSTRLPKLSPSCGT